MRKNIIFIASLVLVAAIASVGLLAVNGRAFAQTGTSTTEEKSNPRILTVTGNGKAFLTPDIVYIYIGVHTEGSDAAEAVAGNTTQSDKVIAALRGLNIDAKDIQTTNFSIYPQQQFDQTGKVTGTIYVVDNTVYVTLRDMAKVGDTLDAVIAAGANSINGIQYDAADKSKALTEARKAAVADARLQAGELAEAAGIELGEIQTIGTFGGSTPIPFYDAKGIGGAGMAASVSVSPGQLVVSVDVNMSFEIK